jgi:hypothetical protein
MIQAKSFLLVLHGDWVEESSCFMTVWRETAASQLPGQLEETRR